MQCKLDFEPVCSVGRELGHCRDTLYETHFADTFAGTCEAQADNLLTHSCLAGADFGGDADAMGGCPCGGCGVPPTRRAAGVRVHVLHICSMCTCVCVCVNSVHRMCFGGCVFSLPGCADASMCILQLTHRARKQKA